MSEPTSTESRADGEHGARGLLDTLGVIVGAVVLAFLVQAFVIKPYRIPSESMVPTLVVGERVLVNRLGNNFGDPKAGQVVVFRPPLGAGATFSEEACGAERPAGTACVTSTGGEFKDTYIKRIAGVGGDRLEVRGGRLIRNGEPVDEPYAQPCSDEICNLAPFTVPRGQFFMMGDNRGFSDDSRYWGPVSRDAIIGRAFATYWPPKRIGGL